MEYKEQIVEMYGMCCKEINLLQRNLDKFIQESKDCQILLSELKFSETNIFARFVYDQYMTQMTSVLNIARKFNIHFFINNLDDTVINALSNGYLDDKHFPQAKLLKDFEWERNLLNNDFNLELGLNACANKIKMPTEMIENNKNDYGKARMKLLELNRKTQIDKTVGMLNTVNDLLHFLLPEKNLDQFKNGLVFEACIVYVRDYKNLEFFICLNDDYKNLYNLSSNINFKLISQELLPADDVFCVLESNGTAAKEYLWRAVVVPDDGREKFQKFVYLIDFGEVIPLMHHCKTFEAPLQYRQIPPLAIKCILTGVKDSSLNCITNDHYKCKLALQKNEFEKAHFRIVYQKNRILYVVMIEKSKTQEIISELKNNDSKNNPFFQSDLNYSTHSARLELPRSILYEKSAEEPILHINSELNDLNSSTNSAGLELPRSILYEKSAKEPILNINSDLNYLNSSTNSAGLELPRSILYEKSAKEPILHINLEVGKIIQVIVTHVVSPISFYGIIQKEDCKDYECFSWHDQQISTCQKQISPPELNDIVLAQYLKDGYWYRAKVINIDLENDFYKVFYVDFGNTENVHLSSLAKCSREQLQDPLRAVLFHLANLYIVSAEENVYSSEKTYSKSVIENMVVLILEQTINVEVVERRNDDLVVRLIDSPYADIPRMLIKMGVVKEI